MANLKAVEKLKLLLKNPRLALLLKAALFGFLLVWINPSGSVSRAGVFIVLSLLLYAQPLFNGISILRSFLALLLLSIAFPATLYGFEFLPLAHAAFFFIISGLKELVLVHRIFWHEALFAVLAYETLLLYSVFYLSHPFLASVAAAAILSALLSELISRETDTPPRRAFLASAAVALLAVSGMFFARMLPLGFWNAANLVALGILFFVEVLMRFYNSKLTKVVVVSRIIIFMFLLTLIFLTSRWHL